MWIVIVDGNSLTVFNKTDKSISSQNSIDLNAALRQEVLDCTTAGDAAALIVSSYSPQRRHLTFAFSLSRLQVSENARNTARM